MRCQKCGALLEDDQDFCPKCGVRVVHEKAVQIPGLKTCSNCGKIIKEGNVFCTSCGTPVDESEKKASDPNEKKCPSCGSKIESDDEYCPICGAMIGNAFPESEIRRPVPPVNPVKNPPGGERSDDPDENMICASCASVIRKGQEFCPICGAMTGAAFAEGVRNTAPVSFSTKAPSESTPSAPNNPVNTPPVNPVSAPPVNPVSAEPVNPVSQPPVNPVMAAPVNPVTSAPVNPVTAAPVNPVTAAPENPVSADEEKPHKCPSCGSEMKPNAKFCPVCGMKADAMVSEEAPEEAAAAPLKCTACGSEYKPGAKFCPVCGMKTDAAPAEPALEFTEPEAEPGAVTEFAATEPEVAAIEESAPEAEATETAAEELPTCAACGATYKPGAKFCPVCGMKTEAAPAEPALESTEPEAEPEAVTEFAATEPEVAPVEEVVPEAEATETAEELPTCAACGATYKPGAKFCPVCGMKTEAAPAEPALESTEPEAEPEAVTEFAATEPEVVPVEEVVPEAEATETAEELPTCAACGTTYKPGAKFCPVCGMKTEAAPAEPALESTEPEAEPEAATEFAATEPEVVPVEDVAPVEESAPEAEATETAAEELPTCAACGATYKPGAKFCPVCGMKTEAAPAEPALESTEPEAEPEAVTEFAATEPEVAPVEEVAPEAEATETAAEELPTCAACGATYKPGAKFCPVCGMKTEAAPAEPALEVTEPEAEPEAVTEFAATEPEVAAIEESAPVEETAPIEESAPEAEATETAAEELPTCAACGATYKPGAKFCPVCGMKTEAAPAEPAAEVAEPEAEPVAVTEFAATEPEVAPVEEVAPIEEVAPEAEATETAAEELPTCAACGATYKPGAKFCPVCGMKTEAAPAEPAAEAAEPEAEPEAVTEFAATELEVAPVEEVAPIEELAPEAEATETAAEELPTCAACGATYKPGAKFCPVCGMKTEAAPAEPAAEAAEPEAEPEAVTEFAATEPEAAPVEEVAPVEETAPIEESAPEAEATETAAEELPTCAACGATYKPGAKFCPVCGMKTEAAPAEPAAEVAEPEAEPEAATEFAATELEVAAIEESAPEAEATEPAEELPTCAACGATYKPGAKFCPVCGMKTDAAPAEPALEFTEPEAEPEAATEFAATEPEVAPVEEVVPEAEATETAADELPTCAACGATYKPGAKFCPVCGMKTEAAPAEPVAEVAEPEAEPEAVTEFAATEPEAAPVEEVVPVEETAPIEESAPEVEATEPVEELPTCAACGATYKPGAKFCPVCGMKTEAAPAEPALESTEPEAEPEAVTEFAATEPEVAPVEEVAPEAEATETAAEELPTCAACGATYKPGAKFCPVCGMKTDAAPAEPALEVTEPEAEPGAVTEFAATEPEVAAIEESAPEAEATETAAEELPTCAACGATYKPGAKFCPVCGMKTEAAPAEPVAEAAEPEAEPEAATEFAATELEVAAIEESAPEAEATETAAEELPTCAACGATYKPGAKFCPVCGMKTEAAPAEPALESTEPEAEPEAVTEFAATEPEVAPVEEVAPEAEATETAAEELPTCAACGATYKPGAKFCPACGMKTEAAPAEPAAEVAEPEAEPEAVTEFAATEPEVAPVEEVVPEAEATETAADELPTCAACGATYKPGAKFCPVCGMKTEAAPAEPALESTEPEAEPEAVTEFAATEPEVAPVEEVVPVEETAPIEESAPAELEMPAEPVNPVQEPVAEPVVQQDSAPTCSHCGAVFKPGAKYCPICGMKADITAAKKTDNADAPHICSSCGSVCKPGAKYCPICGMRTDIKAAAASTCASCGQILKPGAKFCPKCGTKVQ